MPDPAPRTNRAGLALARTVGKFAVAWWAFLELSYHPLWEFYVDRAVDGAISRVLRGYPELTRVAELFYRDSAAVVLFTFAVTLFVGTGLAVTGGVARMIARARARAGQGDFLDRLRRWTTAWPLATRALVAAPALSWFGLLCYTIGNMDPEPGAVERSAITLILAAWGMLAMTRKGMRALLAPTIAGAGADARFAIGPDEIAFDAVAITRETLATVGIFTAVVLAVPAVALFSLFLGRTSEIHPAADGLPGVLSLAAYVAFAATGPFLFRKASRVAVGVDGVHVHGTSRARFFAYRDLDSARANGSALELVRRGKVVLRLQLHGEDAARREAVLARINANVARAREGRTAVAAQIVASASRDDLARVAGGAGDYRAATLTREQLWALVEGPEIEASARKAAAEALVLAGDGAERARLRVAAEHCAEPQVRVALREIAEQGEERDEGTRLARSTTELG
jgi:hypothetical protein